MPPDRGIQAELRGSDTGPLDWDRRCICPACFPAQSIRSNHPPLMRARPAIPIGRELHLLFARHEFAPSSFLDPFAWSVRTRNLPLACPLCAVRERRVAASPNGRNFNNFARVTSTPHSTNPACSYDMCAFGVCFSRV